MKIVDILNEEGLRIKQLSIVLPAVIIKSNQESGYMAGVLSVKDGRSVNFSIKLTNSSNFDNSFAVDVSHSLVRLLY